jgi:hypothetical protein
MLLGRREALYFYYGGNKVFDKMAGGMQDVER